jgi:hypothetical protein
MDNIVRDVNDGWNVEDPMRPIGIQYAILPSQMVHNEADVCAFE